MNRADIDIGEETETPHGWAYAATVTIDGRPRPITVRLSWVDHDHLTGGAVSPSRTAGVALRHLIRHVVGDQAGLDATGRAAGGRASRGGPERDPSASRLPESIDVATVRRMVPGFDLLVQGEMGGVG